MREKVIALTHAEKFLKSLRPFSNIGVYSGEKTKKCFVNPIDQETKNEGNERS